MGLLACSSENSPNKILVSNNFDGLAGWGFEHPSLTSQRAHSGKYAIKIDPIIPYSMSFNQILGTLTNQKPTRIQVEFWAYIPSAEAKARFVCSFKDLKNGKDTFYQDFNIIDKTSNYREWAKITKRLEIPAGVNLSDNFSCYLWRPEDSNEAVYLDDLKIFVLN